MKRTNFLIRFLIFLLLSSQIYCTVDEDIIDKCDEKINNYINSITAWQFKTMEKSLRDDIILVISMNSESFKMIERFFQHVSVDKCTPEKILFLYVDKQKYQAYIPSSYEEVEAHIEAFKTYTIICTSPETINLYQILSKHNEKTYMITDILYSQYKEEKIKVLDYIAKEVLEAYEKLNDKSNFVLSTNSLINVSLHHHLFFDTIKIKIFGMLEYSMTIAANKIACKLSYDLMKWFFDKSVTHLNKDNYDCWIKAYMDTMLIYFEKKGLLKKVPCITEYPEIYSMLFPFVKIDFQKNEQNIFLVTGGVSFEKEFEHLFMFFDKEIYNTLKKEIGYIMFSKIIDLTFKK
ncbi:hypothetical protein TCON_2027 [Astathelohania contejeani]|uniref:Uncharacterized protein n=1 Tax=Astathelohania contejeani TaxID=164912 RepID=A0ABQ7HX46_9MICR|nr:hypothetical protein TCON_2027 [Thelohania contejeani]